MLEISFTSLTYPDEIGAHAYLLEFGSTRIVIDSGIHPKKTGYDTLPAIRDLEPNSIDAILISHAHLDHLGSLPVIQSDHKKATIVMSEPTKFVGKALLHNSVNVMKAQREELGVSEYPLFTHRQIDEQSREWKTRRIGQRFRIDPVDADAPVICEFHPAGHVLGAVAISLSYRDHRVLYTGDIHFEDQSLSRAAKLPEEGIDTLIVETTRGASPRREDYTRESEKNRMGEIIAETFANNGAVLIPVFALGKTQESLLMLHELMLEGVLPPDTPMHIGGLSTKMTMLTDNIGDSWPRLHNDFPLLDALPTLNLLERGGPIPGCRPGHVYLYSSGMMTEHTVSNRFARSILPNPKNALLFVGYADPDSPGGRILAANHGESIDMGHGHTLERNCRVEKFDFSGHAPRRQILDYIERLVPEKTLLVHGDGPARDWFAENLNGSSQIPNGGEKIQLARV